MGSDGTTGVREAGLTTPLQIVAWHGVAAARIARSPHSPTADTRDAPQRPSATDSAAMARPSLVATLLVVGMLISGTINTIMSKFQNNSWSIGCNGDIHQFHKPWYVMRYELIWGGGTRCSTARAGRGVVAHTARWWWWWWLLGVTEHRFQTLIMFLGETFCLLFYGVQQYRERKRLAFGHLPINAKETDALLTHPPKDAPVDDEASQTTQVPSLTPPWKLRALAFQPESGLGLCVTVRGRVWGRAASDLCERVRAYIQTTNPLIFWIPACLDLLGTTLANIGLVYST